MQLYSSVQLREAAVSSSSITRQGRGSPPLPHISTVLTFYFEYPQAASREPSAATQIPTYVLCSLVQLQEAAVSSSSITRQGRRNRPLSHKYLLTFEVFHTLQLRGAACVFEYHPAGSREPSSASHIYLRFMFPNFRTSLPLRVVNHRCDDSPLVFSAQRCNAPVPVTTGQQDKGTRDALL